MQECSIMRLERAPIAWPGARGGGETRRWNYKGQDYMRQSCLEQKDSHSKEREPFFGSRLFFSFLHSIESITL